MLDLGGQLMVVLYSSSAVMGLLCVSFSRGVAIRDGFALRFFSRGVAIRG